PLLKSHRCSKYVIISPLLKYMTIELMLGVSILKYASNGMIAVLFFAFVLSQFMSHTVLTYGITVLTAIIIVISLTYSKGLPKYFGIVMTVISSLILLYQQQGFDVWNTGVTKNLALVLLITMLPILGIPLRLGHLHELLEVFVSKFHK